jgi:hypothetical protein
MMAPATSLSSSLPEDRVIPHGRIAHELRVQRFFQPDDVTCGPTCLRKVYDFYGIHLDLDAVLGEIDRNEDGGTLAVFLGMAALRRGLRGRIFSYDLQIFDPTWAALSPGELSARIEARLPHLRDTQRLRAAHAYLEFIRMGGEVSVLEELTPALLKDVIDREHPLLVGLSATYLYRFARERWDAATDRLVDDDIAGEPTGHFIVVVGYEHYGRRFSLRDPSEHVPDSEEGRLVVDAQRLINAILLGDATYDAVLLELWPAGENS